MAYWFILRPHRLQKEEEALQAIGVPYTIDEDLKKNGILYLELTIEKINPHFNLPDGIEDLNLVIVFPDTYPFFRPLVYAPSLNLLRHQNIIDKNLCLLGRATENWLPDTLLTEHLSDQLSKVIIKGSIEDLELIQNDEHEQAEPVSEYYASVENPVLFNPPEIIVNDQKKELIEFLGTIKIGIPKGAILPTRMAVLESQLQGSKETKHIPEVIKNTYTKTLDGLIFYIPEPPPKNPQNAISWLKRKTEEQNQKLKLPGKTISVQNGTIKNIIGFCFKEEVEKGVPGLGWVFLIESSRYMLDQNGKERKDLPQKPINFYAKSVKVNGDIDLVRTPKLKCLSKKKAAVIGLGALGGLVTLELARNGIGALSLLDGDIVEAPTTVRWPLGLSAAGLYKTEALHDFIKDNYPATGVTYENWRIGGGRITADKTKGYLPLNEYNIINNILDGASIIIDATAEVGVHNFLTMLAKERKIPYICLSASPGGYGGVVMRMKADNKGGCWMCMKYMQDENKEMIPNLDDANGLVQPPGCGDVTFTGTSFDLGPISLLATRLAVSTMCSNEEDGYPDVEWDIAVLNSFNAAGDAIAPEWKVWSLPVHKQCSYCN